MHVFECRRLEGRSNRSSGRRSRRPGSHGVHSKWAVRMPMPHAKGREVAPDLRFSLAYACVLRPSSPWRHDWARYAHGSRRDRPDTETAARKAFDSVGKRTLPFEEPSSTMRAACCGGIASVAIDAGCRARSGPRQRCLGSSGNAEQPLREAIHSTTCLTLPPN